MISPVRRAAHAEWRIREYLLFPAIYAPGWRVDRSSKAVPVKENSRPFRDAARINGLFAARVHECHELTESHPRLRKFAFHLEFAPGTGQIEQAGLPADGARSTYYDQPDTAVDDTALVETMGQISDSFEAYGYRRMQAALAARHRRQPQEGQAVDARA
ncbi:MULTISPECIES: hypothetical protein [unclassified Mesorhizobium]|uniref:hypothetical protein n=1 Tax=unclassified Mesorhizobium TaxID=325217 RepID=UPI00112B6E4E|nr:MULTISPECIES: hypothetical protein [unclassified Mesorhizobium]MCA0025680.1 hypothetical protein [Mesorhizobium sp. B263B1A]TPI53482.1 hypothetical protein FJW11_11780 [Mesorhizobium sp. B3-1-1]TPJ68302.1 hypothetical protein FJ462_14200 [Mesorhizobium sp. B2-6-7]TPJ86844.1 hypothetical protein FJ422_10710 [Mesorhizobium sp. B2-6-3]TPJ92385.1 hypothetical protein FJ489_23955 [Mesorhizobium sp. B2-5-12]